MLDEIKGEDLNFSQIFKGTAYIDPNDFGDIGYSFLPVALAAFRREDKMRVEFDQGLRHVRSPLV